MKYNKPYDKSVWRSLTMVMQFGINMIVPIGMMTALGIWLDNKFDTSFWTILLFFIGAIAGGQNIYRMAKQALRDEPDRRCSTADREGKHNPQTGMAQTDENNRSIKETK